MKNITRYTYEKTAFQGWRLCLSRNKVQYVRYFADKGAGSAEAALAEARRVRQCIWDDLAALSSLDAASVAQVFAKYR